jgi:hypothetical protein
VFIESTHPNHEVTSARRMAEPSLKTLTGSNFYSIGVFVSVTEHHICVKTRP